MTRAPSTLLRKSSSILAFALLALPALPGVEAYPTQGMVAEWHLDEASGLSAADSSGNGNQGTLINFLNEGALVNMDPATARVAGRHGNALIFDGANDYVDVGPGGVPNNPSQLTQSAWIKTTASPARHVVLTKRHADDGSDWPTLMVQNGHAILSFDDRGYINNIEGTTNVADGQWHHIAGVRDQVSFSIYVDGVLENTRTDTNAMDGSNAPMHVGHHGGWNDFFPGTIDEVRVYSRALTAAEVVALFNDNSPQTPQGEWRFDESSGTTAVNTAPNEYHPVAHQGRGVRFDGHDDYVAVPHSASLQPSQVSVMSWVKFDSFKPAPASCGASMILTKGNDRDAGNYRLFACQSGGAWRAVFAHGTLGNMAIGTTALQTDTWYHLAATFDGSNQRVYVNGVLETTHATTIPLGSTSAALWLGRQNIPGFEYPLDGTLDEVRIYDRALSAQEIRLVMDQASLPSAPTNPQVTHGPGDDGLTFTWAPPLEGTLPITKYRVFGGDSLGEEEQLAELEPTVFSYQESGLGYSHTRYYRVSAENAYGEGPKALAVGTTYSPGHMLLTDLPDCSPTPTANPVEHCNSERFGFTDTIDASDPNAPEFTLDWGDFNGHESVGCGAQACTFWLEFNLGADSPTTSYTDFNGQTVPIAQLQRWTGSTWTNVVGGLIEAEIAAPVGQPWSLLMPGNLLLTHDALATSQGATAFRLVSATRPDGGVWELDLDAAMGQLVAPPALLLHGWNPHVGEDDYNGRAGWGGDMELHLISRSLFVFGQDPWAWSGAIVGGVDDGAIINPAYDGKKDFRLSAFDIYDRILAVRADPHETGDALTYDGPVNIFTHSMGGLASRYLLETILPDLQGLNHGTLAASDSISKELNEHNHVALLEPDEVVSSLVMVGTPNLGSGWASKYVALNDAATIAASCQQWNCGPYYVEKGGSSLRLPKTGPWWTERVGAYQNWDLFDDPVHLSLMADFELQRMTDGNPVLVELEQTFEPQDVDYFFMAGDRSFGGDLIVSIESATHQHDDRACRRVYDNTQVNYNLPIPGTAFHSDLPSSLRLHDDALVFMGGEKESVCENQPTNGASSVGLLGEGGLAMSSMSMETLEVGEQSLYEAPIALNLTVAESVYSIRFDWMAPGASTGTLALLASNGTLEDAAVELRSPSGATATLAGGDTALAEWTGPEAVGEDHLLEVLMPAAEQGAWTLWINRSTQWPGIVVPTLAFDTPLGIATETDPYAVLGEPAAYRIRVTDAGSPVLGAVVSLDLVDPGSGAQTLLLLDNGLAPDEQAADGVYSAGHTFFANGTAPYQATATFAGTQLSVEGGIAVLDEAPAPRSFPPWMPLNLSASRGPGWQEITLTWEPPVGGPALTGYDVYRGNETVQDLVASIGNEATYTDSGLDANATYHYRVASRNEAGWSQSSNLANATTFAEPTAPQNLEAEAGIGNVTLTWQPADSDGGAALLGYEVYRGNASGAETPYATLGVVLDYTDGNATPGTRYHYRVASRTTAGEGPLSNEVSARPSSLLLSLPGIPLPVGIPPTGAAITVCDAGSDAGCQVPGESHLCVELRVSPQPAMKLACVDHALVPLEVDAALHDVSPIEIGHPGLSAGSTPEIQVTYLHEASLLDPILVACAPLHPTFDDAAWLLANGNEASLTVTLKGDPVTGEPVTVPGLGQLVAAGKATLGVIPCG